LTLYPRIQKTLGVLAFVCMAASHAQVTDSISQSALNYRHFLVAVDRQHPSVQSALNQIESARQEVTGAKWQFGPTPSVGVEKSSKVPDGLTDRRTSYARLQQPVWTGGRLTAQLDRAQAQESIARLSMEEQRLSLAARWLQVWADVQAAELKIQALAESEDQHRKYVLQVQSRAKEGQAPRSDVQLSLTRLAAVQAELEQARTQKRQAISRLEQMYGATLPVQAIQWTAPLQAVAAAPTQPPRLPSDWLSQVQEKHPTLQKAQEVARTVRADIELAKSRAYPEVYVRGEVLHGDVTKNTQQIYVGVSSSFGAGLSTLTAIAANQARLEAQEHEAEARRREIAEQVLADVENLESQTQRLRYLEQAYNSADDFLQSSERQFAAGRKSWQELMNTAREKAQALTQLADAKTFLWLAQQRLNLLSMGIDTYLNSNANP
jgi:adhesin transport system outer membrane protein